MIERRVHGGPGCGKTTYLETLLAQAVERFGADAVVLVSFTRAAAQELRIRGLAGGAFKGVRVGTLHKFGFVALGHPKMAEDDIDDWNQRFPDLALSTGSKWNDELGEGGGALKTDGDRAFAALQIARARVESFRHTAIELRFEREWAAWKQERGTRDLTDLIDWPMPIPDEARCVIVDEAQDLTPLELRRVRSWQPEELWLVGDADQSIYGFRGAEPREFLTPDIGPEFNTVLERSYRLPSAVRDYALRWIQQNDDRYPVTYQPVREGGDVARARGVTLNDAGIVAQMAREASGKVMVLASCGYMLRPVIEELRRTATPYWNPYRSEDRYWNPMKTVFAARVQKFIALGVRSKGTYLRWWTWKDLDEWLKATKGILTSDLRRRVTQQAEASTEEDQERLTTKEIAEAFDYRWPELEAVMSQGPQEQLAWFMSHLNAEARKTGAYVLDALKTHGPGVLLTKPNIIIGTIHSVKGGEADTVILSPDVSPAATSMREARSVHTPENVRVAYVGMTRAKDRLVLLSPTTRLGLNWSV